MRRNGIRPSFLLIDAANENKTLVLQSIILFSVKVPHFVHPRMMEELGQSNITNLVPLILDTWQLRVCTICWHKPNLANINYGLLVLASDEAENWLESVAPDTKVSEGICSLAMFATWCSHPILGTGSEIVRCSRLEVVAGFACVWFTQPLLQVWPALPETDWSLRCGFSCMRLILYNIEFITNIAALLKEENQVVPYDGTHKQSQCVVQRLLCGEGGTSDFITHISGTKVQEVACFRRVVLTLNEWVALYTVFYSQ